MLRKCIKVTDDNKGVVAQEYGITEDDRIDEMVGFYAVADFGATTFDLLTRTKLVGYYIPTEKQLGNGWIEVETRLPSATA